MGIVSFVKQFIRRIVLQLSGDEKVGVLYRSRIPSHGTIINLSNYHIIILFLCFSSTITVAQDSLRVSVIANVKKDAIQLRWAVNTPRAWKLGNQYGYRVERYTVVRNNEILDQPEKVVLTQQPIKPQPLDNWESLATKNDYAAIIAQAIYGKDFQLTGNDTKGVSKFIALAQELEQRYMVSMYAADLSYPAALLAGWGWEDKTVKPGERYLYRVFAAVPENVLKIEMGSVYVSLNEYQELPKPQELTAIFGDKSVMLTWNYGILSKVYIAYHIEKSYDGKSFQRLSEIPFMNMNSKDGKPADRMYYIDSLANNSMKVWYRVIGVNSFSEEGPACDAVTGKGENRLIYNPHITRAIPNDQDGVDIEWEFDERGNSLIKNFELQRGDNHNGPFVPVMSAINPDQRKLTYNKLKSSNYFVIAAVPENGEPTLSFPVLVQPLDTVPPSIPSGLKGVVDSLGIVRLSWNANKENDLLGYRVFRAQTKGEELIPLNDIAVRTNQFTDTVDVRNLNSKVYYAVTALDMRYNQSDKSPVTELLKPDLVPPSPPLITNYRVTDKGVKLEWVTGMEENIAALHLFRKDSNPSLNSEQKPIQIFSDVNLKEYTDKTIEPDRSYTYTLKAVTERGLASPASPPVTIKTTANASTSSGKITEFNAKINKKKKHIELSWKHNLSNVKEFEIYKGENGKPVSLWKVVKAFEQKLDDSDVRHGLGYEYIIKAILENGKTGGVKSTKSL
jgi:uncharacterized protein